MRGGGLGLVVSVGVLVILWGARLSVYIRLLLYTYVKE